MKTTKHAHEFFPTGKGLVIVWENELVLFYALDDRFTVWHTGESFPKTPDELNALLTVMAYEFPIQGSSQCAILIECLDDMPDQVLGAIYEAVVGYDPFLDNPYGAEANRRLVCEYMTMPETLAEVFGLDSELEKMEHEYRQFLADNKLPEMSAEELVVNDTIKLKQWQRSYLTGFIDRWNEVEMN
jgi:hypothetical protein